MIKNCKYFRNYTLSCVQLHAHEIINYKTYITNFYSAMTHKNNEIDNKCVRYNKHDFRVEISFLNLFCF